MDPLFFNTFPKREPSFFVWIGSISLIDMFLLWCLLHCSVCENLFNQCICCLNDDYFRLLLNMTILMSTWRLWMLLLILFLKIKWYVDYDTLWYFVYYVYVCAHIWGKKKIFNLKVFANNIVSLEHLCNYTDIIELITWLC